MRQQGTLKLHIPVTGNLEGATNGDLCVTEKWRTVFSGQSNRKMKDSQTVRTVVCNGQSNRKNEGQSNSENSYL